MASSRTEALTRRRRVTRRRLSAHNARRAATLVAAVAGVAFAGQATAGDPKLGRAIADQKCMVCHGIDGIAKIAEAPNLAGQNEGYLTAQLGAFKSGVRQNEMMSIVIQPLSDTDIANLAAYYSAIEITVGKLPGG
jgi:cytochrome c553